SNGAVIGNLQQQYFPVIEANYQKFGFKRFRILPKVDKEQIEEDLKALAARQQEQQEMYMQQAAEVIASNEKRKKDSQDLAPLSGPIQLGRNIPADELIMPMGNILEEERRATIQGYVFDVEVRELRSKRKIIIIKMTDYTSSFIVKKFSNNEKDEQ